MKQPGQHQDYVKQQQLPNGNPQMRAKQSNYSIGSQMSFNGQNKKQKSKSFNRKQTHTQQQNLSIIKIYRQLSYSVQIKNILKKFCYVDKQKLLKLSITQLRSLCQKQLRRIQYIKRNNIDIQRLLTQEDIQDTDNQLSLIALTCQAKSIIQFNTNQINSNGTKNGQSIQKVKLRQYQNILLEVQKSDQLVKNFINTNLKLPQPSDISIIDCKKFFKKQAYQMNQSSDKIILSRRNLCQIIIFLCRLLEGQILAFDDIYQYQNQSFNSIQMNDQNNRLLIQSKNNKNHQIIIQNLDRSFSDNNSQQSHNSNLNKNHKNNTKTYQSYSNDDLGKKVFQLAGICQQIPQLQAFTRTLKFSKITLQNRESFFKIVDVIIALHHKIGYLSRNKPTLLRQIQGIQNDLTQVYESIRIFISNLLDEIPQFTELKFKTEQDSKHQLSQTLSYLRKDMKKLADIILDQNRSQEQLYEKIQLLSGLIKIFCQSINENDEVIWQDYVNKILSKDLNQDQIQVVNWLSQCYNNIYTEIKLGHRQNQQLQTQRNLQAQVHTLLTDYQRLRGQHQQLQGKYNILLEQKDQLIFDIEERDKIISNLTNKKISAEKRQKSLRDQILQLQQDSRHYQHDLTVLEQKLQIMSIQNQNNMNEILFEHQEQVKQLVDKITVLQRAKMQLLSKYQEECNKSIRMLQDGNSNNVQIQTLKDRLQKKIKQNDQTTKKYKDHINNLQKQLQQLKNQKGLIQNKYELAQKNKNKLMEKLDQVNSRYSENVKDFEDKYEDEIVTIKQSHYKIQKQLQKYKRSNGLLMDQIQQLKAQHSAQVKTSNEYRQKLIQLNSIQNEYDLLGKEYQRLIQNYHKMQNNSQGYKQKIYELTSKQQQLLQLLGRQKQLVKKIQKKNRDLQCKLQDIIGTYEGVDMQLKQQQKINKILQKKISQLQLQIQTLQDNIVNKDKNHSILLNKSQNKYQTLNQQLQSQNQQLNKIIAQLKKQNQKYIKENKLLDKQFKQYISQKQQKDMQWLKGKNIIQKKLKDKQQQLSDLQNKYKLLDQQSYNQSILFEEIKSQKILLEIKINDLQNNQTEKDQLRKSIFKMEENQNKLKTQIQNLQNQVKRLYQEIQKLKIIMKSKDQQLQSSQQKVNKKLKDQQDRQNQQKQKQYEQKNKQYENKSKQIIHLRQQIMIEKNVIMQQNNKLHEQNNSLQQQINKLKGLNDLLQKNINKLQTASRQAKDDFIQGQSELKQTLTKNIYTITSLQNELTSINSQRQLLRRDYDQIQQKLQCKCKLVAQKDNLLFERQLQKTNLDKLIKELKYKITELQSTIQGLNITIQKLKNNKIKSLQNQIIQLNSLISEWKKKQQQGRSVISDLQSQIQKVRKDSNRKIQCVRQERQQVQQTYKNQIKKLSSQYEIDLSSIVIKTRKQVQNEYNQLLIRQKQTMNNMSIQKMQQLGQMQRKYDKLIKQQRNDKNILQQQYNKLQKQYNELKRNKSLNASRVKLQQVQNNNVLDELQKIRSQYEILKRQSSRLIGQNNRLSGDIISQRQQNTILVSKSMQSQHIITILNSKINILSQNIQNNKLSLQQINKIQLEKINLQRQLQKFKNKNYIDQNKINNYKQNINQLQNKLQNLSNQLVCWKNKQLQWNKINLQSTERLRQLTNQTNDMSQKLAQMKLKLTQITNKLIQTNQSLQSKQTQLQLTQQKVKQKQIELKATKQKLQNEINTLQQQLQRKSTTYMTLQRQQRQMLNEWQHRQSQLNEQSDKKNRRVRQLQIELNEYKKNSQQGNKLIDEISSIKSYCMQLQDKNGRLNGQYCRINGDKIVIERQNQSIKRQVNQLNKQKLKYSKQITEMNEINNNLSIQNVQLTRLLQQLRDQIKKIKQYNIRQMRKLQQRLKQQYQKQKKIILADCEQVIKSINQQVKKEQLQTLDINNKYNRLLLQLEDNNKIIQKLRKQNMQLSQHCQTYQSKIHNLQNDHKTKGQFNVQIQSKYHITQNQKYQLQQNNQSLSNQLQLLTKQIKQLKLKIVENQKQNKQLKQKLFEQEKQIKQLRQKLFEEEKQNEKINNFLVNLQSKYKQSLSDIQKYKSQTQILNHKISLQIQQNQSLKQQINNVQHNFTGSNQQLQRLRRQNKDINLKLLQKSRQIQGLRVQSGSSNVKIIQTTTIINGLQNDNKSLQQKIIDMTRQLQVLANQFRVVQQRLAQAEGYIQWLLNQKNGFQQKVNQTLSQLQKFDNQIKSLQSKLFDTQSEKNKKQYENKNQTAQNQSLKRRILQLQSYVQNLQVQQKQNQVQKTTQQSLQIQRLRAELALTRQQIMRLHDTIKRKQQDFEKQIMRLTQQKSVMWKQNQALAQQCQNLKARIIELQRLYQLKTQQLDRQRQLLIQSQRKQQQLTRTLINQQGQVRRISNEIQSYKGRLSSFSQQGQEMKVSQSRLRQQKDSLSSQIARLQSELAVMRMQYSRIHGLYNKQVEQLKLSSEQISRLNQQLGRQRIQIQRYYHQSSSKEQTIIHLRNQIQRITNESNTKQIISQNTKEDYDRLNNLLMHLRQLVGKLQVQNNNIRVINDNQQKTIKELDYNMRQATKLLQNADKKITQQRCKFSQDINNIRIQNNKYIHIITIKQTQIHNLKQIITRLQIRINQLNTHIQRIQSNSQQALNQSRSSINLVTKSYSYQGGQVTAAQLNRLQEQIKRLIKQIQNRDRTIEKNQFQIQKLYKQIKILKQQIQLLSQGKTINIKGYTRVTNPNDTSLNIKGIVYTQYDIRQLKAKLQLTQKSLKRYQDRQTQLLTEIEKYKFRERHYLEQIRILEENAKLNKNKQQDTLPELPTLNSPVKKTSFDQNYNNRSNNPQSSTYRLQTGIQVTQKTINMTKKQNRASQKVLSRVQGEQLRRIIQRLSNGQQIMSSKIDEVLNSSQKVSRQSIELILVNNQFNLTTNIISQIRQMIHQNKALIQTLRSLKNYREDVSLLIQEYVDPQLLTQFVYRILKYFSQVEEGSKQAFAIRQELNLIRRNNVGGYYFTALEEYTTYILENNSIEIYKQELKQKARQLLIFKDKFQAVFEQKLSEKDKLLNKSDSKNSLLNRSRGKYTGNSRIRSGSQISKEDSSRVRQYIPVGNRISVGSVNQSSPPLPNQSTNGVTHLNITGNSTLSPMLITVNNHTDRPRTSSNITYTPYNTQILPSVSTPTQSINESRANIVYSANSSNYMGNSYTNINSSNANIIRTSFQRR